MTDQEKAKSDYREAWAEWRECLDDARRRQLEDLMDSLQPAIAPGPSHPDWKEFRESLPAYLAYWSSTRDRTAANLRENSGPEHFRHPN